MKAKEAFIQAEGGIFDMTFDVLSSLAVYALVTGWSPGPNNVLLLSTTGRFGLKRSMKLITGIWTGFLTIMLLCAVFSVGLGRLLPGAVPYLKYIGAAYILYLAFTVLKRKPVRADDGTGKDPSFVSGFLLQFINVKVILYGISALSSYVLPYESSVPALIFFAFFLTFFGATGNLVWALIGSIFQKWYNKYYMAFNIIIALLLVRCSVKLIL
nr:LysE family transporter [uncultured Blautia sp.]